MQYRILGATGVEVSRLCMGTMSFGSEADESASAAMFERALDAGINFFDTADVYGRGKSEEILGRLVSGERDRLVLATKAHFPTGKDRNDRGLSRRHLNRAVEASLKRLGTDRIDLYYAHGFDANTPIEEVVRALDSLVERGLVLYLGVSNWAAWQIATALGIARQELRSRFQCIQPMYNLVKRQVEVELLPLAEANALGVVSYSPLGGGLLTGKYGVDRAPSGGRLTTNKLYKQRYAEPIYREVADRFSAHARERDIDPTTLAVAWVCAQPTITSAIIGARDVGQLDPSLAAAELVVDDSWRQEIAALAPTPPPATDRLEEQAGLVYGVAASSKGRP